MSLMYNDMFGEHNKIETAIERLRSFESYALKLDDEGYYVADSGGKDSTVIKQLCIEAGVKFGVHHNHTSVDHPETVYFVRREQQRFRDMGYNYVIEYATDKDGKRVTMWDLIKKWGYPTQCARFCCRVLKERGGTDRVVVTGVRWAESAKRKNKRGAYEAVTLEKKDKIVLNNDNDNARRLIEQCVKKSKVVVNPIIDWEDEDVWEYIRSRNLPYNPLYDMGWKRVGCVGCPQNTRNKQELNLMPKYKQMYIHSGKAYLETHSESFSKTPEQYYDWWVSHKGAPTKESITMFDETEEDE